MRIYTPKAGEGHSFRGCGMHCDRVLRTRSRVRAMPAAATSAWALEEGCRGEHEQPRLRIKVTRLPSVDCGAVRVKDCGSQRVIRREPVWVQLVELSMRGHTVSLALRGSVRIRGRSVIP